MINDNPERKQETVRAGTDLEKESNKPRDISIATIRPTLIGKILNVVAQRAYVLNYFIYFRPKLVC